MPPKPFHSYRPVSSAFIIGLLDEQLERPLRILYLFPIGENYVQWANVSPAHRLPANTASSFKILDAVRLAATFLGVLSFPPGMPIPGGVAWVSAHQVENDTLSPDITEELDGQVVKMWENRILWLRINGAKTRTRDAVAKEMVDAIGRVPFVARTDTTTLYDRFEAEFGRSARICEITGDPFPTELMHLIAHELGSGVFYYLLQSVEHLGNEALSKFDDETLEEHLWEPEMIIGNPFMQDP
ncbi:hypothetical protein C8R44DRAFT_769503 [Mycena epipterygia]|nr:hypothetical protein C8R44DRAFT_769503 [Mycena epipterygia]